MKTFRLYKKQKLCSVTAIERLFGPNGEPDSSFLQYPLRAVWRHDAVRRSDAPLAFLISVPKRRLHHAVDRVQMRRRIREAFRLNHQSYPLPEDKRIDVAFIYVGNKLHSYASVERAMRRILEAIQHYYAADNQ